jgi:hypothetical protein
MPLLAAVLVSLMATVFCVSSEHMCYRSCVTELPPMFSLPALSTLTRKVSKAEMEIYFPFEVCPVHIEHESNITSPCSAVQRAFE